MDVKLKQIQAIELESLKEIHRICKENNLKYSLAYGTILGAVRHNGFIPWDDDTDLYMPYNDLIVLEGKIDRKRFFLQTEKTILRCLSYSI